ncbi:hypothetical protein [Erythrobacter ani]|uniref:Lipoprotein n=1 Tax=Erythrobacter ani TaxID=2827235 RepID=A0ABS6SQ20_9SPHN|nr:hypothetical protein [Erythrobacter ani]MBV7266931.1 hypothetical protein [Erythrobacter ani]
MLKTSILTAALLMSCACTEPSSAPETKPGALGAEVAKDVIRAYEHDPALLMIQLRGAHAIELTLEAGRTGSRSVAQKASKLTFLWVTCLSAFEKSRGLEYGWASKTGNALERIVINTDERRKFARAFEQLRDGTVSRAPDTPLDCGYLP